MTIITVQNCVSTQPYFERYILSLSEPGRVYKLLISMPGDDPSEYICTCKGFEFRGHCRHQHEVIICGWEELVGPEEQDDTQWEDHLCPRCGNDTIEELAYVDDANSNE